MLNGILHRNGAATILAWIFGLFGIAANICVIFIAGKRYTAHHKTNRGRHIYTFLIANLAIADFCGSLYCVIIAIADYYYGKNHHDLFSCDLNNTCNNLTNIWLSNPGCSIARFLAMIAIYVSALITLIIAVDRYRAVVYPYNQKRLSTKQIHLVTLVSWLVGITAATITLVKSFDSLNLNRFDDFTNMCYYSDPETVFFQVFTIITFVVIIGSYISTSILYSMIVIFLRHNRIKLKSIDHNCLRSRLHAEKHVTIITSIITFSNLISWLPGLAVAIGNIADNPFLQTTIGQAISIVGFMLLFVNSLFNPIIYITLTSKYCKLCCHSS